MLKFQPLVFRGVLNMINLTGPEMVPANVGKSTSEIGPFCRLSPTLDRLECRFKKANDIGEALKTLANLCSNRPLYPNSLQLTKNCQPLVPGDRAVLPSKKRSKLPGIFVHGSRSKDEFSHQNVWSW